MLRELGDSKRMDDQCLISATNPLVFVHVMKTAGLSIREAITANLDEDDAAGVYEVGDSTKERNDIENAIDRGVRFYSGHYSASHICWIFNERNISPWLFSFCREPEDRIFSLYHYVRQKQDDKLYDPSNKYHFDDFCRYLYYEHPDLICNVFYNQTVLPSPANAEQPSEYLTRYWFVGTIGQLETFAKTAEEKFKLTINIGRTNVTGAKPDLAPSARRRTFLERCNDLDFQIFDKLEHGGALCMGTPIPMI
jgi:hypothetical protein